MGKSLVNKGDQYGKLILTGNKKIETRMLVEAKCECGNIVRIRLNSLKTGCSTSCGCNRRAALLRVNTKHSHSQTRIGKIRYNMIKRCYDENCWAYKRYGGRGIIVCKERGDINCFVSDMIDSYNKHANAFGEKNTTLDRIDTNGNYCIENCKRSTRKQQSRNTRRNTIVNVFNKDMLVTDACLLLGLSYNTIRDKKYKKKLQFQYLINEHINKFNSDEYNILKQKFLDDDTVPF